jgi:hypothetical protein
MQKLLNKTGGVAGGCTRAKEAAQTRDMLSLATTTMAVEMFGLSRHLFLQLSCV